jgi:hypothetical protein
LLIAPDDDVSAPTAISSIRTSFRDILGAVQMSRACPTFSGLAMDLNVINEIWRGHGWELSVEHKDNDRN